MNTTSIAARSALTLVLSLTAFGCASAAEEREKTSIGEEALKSLRLTTGNFYCDAAGCGFTPFDVHVNMAFQVSGCGFSKLTRLGNGGESVFSGNPDPNWTYGYDTDATGCIAQGGSSDYTAPAVAGAYTIRFYTWSDKAPYGELAQGTYTVNVLP